jgi:hypothetical protein
MRASVKDIKRNLLRTIIIHIILEIYNSMNTPERSERTSSTVPGMT